MDWSNEEYVRVYTRDTGDLLALGWEGRAVWYELLRKVDRAGILDHGGDLDVVPEMLRIPPEIFERALPRLRKRGMVEMTDTKLVIPNFVEAQTASKTDKQRQRESRNRRRDQARAEGAAESDAKAAARSEMQPPVTDSDHMESQGVTDESHEVTEGHSESPAVTPSHPRADAMRCDAREGAPGGDPAPVKPATLSLTPDEPGPKERAAAKARELALAGVEELNRRKGSGYSPVADGVLKNCQTLARQDFTPDDMREVVEHKCREWLGNPRMEYALRPKTLFLPSNFRDYLDEARAEKKQKHVASSVWGDEPDFGDHAPVTGGEL